MLNMFVMESDGYFVVWVMLIFDIVVVRWCLVVLMFGCWDRILVGNE